MFVWRWTRITPKSRIYGWICTSWHALYWSCSAARERTDASWCDRRATDVLSDDSGTDASHIDARTSACRLRQLRLERRAGAAPQRKFEGCADPTRNRWRNPAARSAAWAG